MDASAKQQVVERLKQAQNILVTVSANPTVDQLAACIGLTLLLNKTGKHSTAVFSGAVPSTIEFLQPEKTLEQTTDSLRDFIISLDKDKADKLRYKVEDNVVKIFITPYRTSINEKDLVFSQGDFNVEAVVALGVQDKSQLDAAITAHGRILHDATVISVNAGGDKGKGIGQLNWLDETASSLSEMIVSISEALGSNLIDSQMATAFLTGIVAETERFSNPKTSPKVMTMSAQLMAAGANQQLIVSKLESVLPTPHAQPDAAKQPPGKDGTLSVKHNELPQAMPTEEKKKEEPKAPALNLLEDKPKEPTPEEESHQIDIDREGNLHNKDKDGKQDDKSLPMPGSHTLLNPLDNKPVMESPFTASTEPEWGEAANASSDPFSDSSNNGILTHGPTIKPPEPKSDLDLDSLGVQTESETSAPDGEAPHIEQARSAVESAFAAAPFDPANNPVEALNATPLEPAVGSPPVAEPPQEDKPDMPAPPPVPPPLVPSPGVVIPSHPYGDKDSAATGNPL